ncbi:MAG: flotillin-like FloA family protein, partial [Clostridia bacterium]|nr:flotillin-like FloA family protein [Clostridia bacterium]
TQEMKALVIEAESQVPKAMAEALKSGKLGVMDYYNMQNVMADTNMRNAIGGVEEEAQTIEKSKKGKK